MDDAPDWVFFDDVLDEMGMTPAEFREAYPHVSLDHTGTDGRTVLDWNELDR